VTADYDTAKAAWVEANVATAPPIGPCGKAELGRLLDTSGQLPDGSVASQSVRTVAKALTAGVTSQEGYQSANDQAGETDQPDGGMSAERESAR
jgi:hypothetical protein